MTTTITTQGDDRPLKVDRLGRVRTSRAEREAILDRFEQSAMPGTRFAELHGIKYQTFASWVQNRRGRRGRLKDQQLDLADATASELEEARQTPRFALAEMMTGQRHPDRSSSERALCIELPGGGKLEVSEPGQVALAVTLLKALSSQPSC